VSAAPARALDRHQLRALIDFPITLDIYRHRHTGLRVVINRIRTCPIGPSIVEYFEEQRAVPGRLHPRADPGRLSPRAEMTMSRFLATFEPTGEVAL